MADYHVLSADQYGNRFHLVKLGFEESEDWDYAD